MPYILQTNQLTKSIGGKNLVTNVSMHVKKGEFMVSWDRTVPVRPQL